MAFKKNTKDSPSFRINDELRGDYDVRIIGEGIQSRVVTLSEAKRVAESMNLDIIEVNNKTSPPIMRVANYEKMIYEMKKMAKKTKQQTKQLKEVQLSVNISDHDLQTKANKAREFINDGNKVKVVLTMRGRELSRRDVNKKSILEFIVALSDISVPESQPRDEGNKTIVILKKKG